MLYNNREQLLEAVCTWLNIRFEHDREKLMFTLEYPHQMKADMDHSSLLHRLLLGKQPLDLPPPIAYSYPCYALVEGEDCSLGGCGPSLDPELDGFYLGQARWDIVKKISDREYIIKWPTRPEHYRAAINILNPEGEHDWRVRRVE